MTPAGRSPEENVTNAGSPRTDETRPSRSEQTRTATEVTRLGLQLTGLSPADLDRLALPERLREEIEVNQKLKPRSRGRQNRLIGQLLRAEDHEEIRVRLAQLKSGHHRSADVEKANEAWVARLVEEGDSAVEAFIAEFPAADRQRFRSFVRSIRQDPLAKKAKRARREMLRAVRELRAGGS